jgi:hypothetical protein
MVASLAPGIVIVPDAFCSWSEEYHEPRGQPTTQADYLQRLRAVLSETRTGAAVND